VSREARRIEIFLPDEFRAILTTAERELPEQAAIVSVLALAGVRVGEALALQVDDLDFRQAELWVQRTWGREHRALGNRQIGSPKSGEAGRVLMSQELARVLQAHVSLLQAEAAVAGQPTPIWLFPEPGRETPMRPNYFYKRVWRPLLRRAAVRYRKPHTMRHTYASVLLASGAPLTFVRDQLRHSSITITADVYGHLIPRAHRETLDAIDQFARGRRRDREPEPASSRDPVAAGLRVAP
jgi:integrase